MKGFQIFDKSVQDALMQSMLFDVYYLGKEETGFVSGKSI
jgi:hypothetical protein